MNERVAILYAGPVSRDDAFDVSREFEERLADSARLAFRVAYSVLRCREDAEDVAQEALARAYQRIGALRERERFRAWLVRICWRLALDHRRAGLRRQRREQVAADTDPALSAEDLAAASEFRRRLLAAIDGLPEKLRIVIVLAGIQGHDVGEVASLLALPEGTVKSRLHHARRRLMEVLR
jgi:RNA polymerase sigma-70 factor (ECF subfamily)